ncbi:MAG: hypothetical protein MUC50_00205 [Myxococcota bacterium]|nr:hypothetical protein [Myxococcota bacterium]
MARKKIKAREENQTPVDPNSDEFIQKTTSALDFAYEHRRPLMLAAAVALIAAIVGIAVNHFASKKIAERSMTLAKGLEAIVAPVTPAPEGEEVPPKDDQRLTFDSLKARATESLKAIGQVPANVGGGVEVAKLLVEAASHYDLGEYEKAIAGYESLAGRKEQEIEFVQPTVLEGLGLSLEAAGRKDDAKKRFEALSKLPGISGELGKYHVARMSESGDVEQAKKLYKEIVMANAERDRKSSRDYLFVHARNRLLALDPSAEVPAPIGGGLEGIDPEMLKQLMQMQGGGLN